MRAYILKRLLLMFPTLFGISMILWVVVTSAPGDPGQASFGEAQTQRGEGAGESRRIFRTQFNLDKPIFWNDYVSLTAEDVLDRVRTAADTRLPGKVRSKADATLSDWGNYAVPALIRALDLAATPYEKAAVLLRLRSNAKRTGATRVGRRFTEEERKTNREILAESRDIDDHLALDLGALGLSALRDVDAGKATGPVRAVLDQIEPKATLWRDWFREHEERWTWSGGEKFRREIFDTQFAKYWWNLLRFDLGDSHVYKEPVLRLILRRIPISATLSVTSLILAYLISVPLGVWAAVRHRKLRERAVSTALFMLYSLASFFVATLLLRYLGIGQPFKWIPVSGFESQDTFPLTTWEHIKDVLHHTIAPIFCMTYASFAALSRFAKSGLLNVIRSDYVRTARAKGLGEAVVILKHALRNGIIPIVTLLGTTLPVVVGGSIIVESVFGIPGIGLLLWESITQRDYNVVIGDALIVGVLVMVGILISDLLYAVVDPRISYE